MYPWQRNLIFSIILIGVLFVGLSLPKYSLAGDCCEGVPAGTPGCPNPCGRYDKDSPECGACLAAPPTMPKPTEEEPREYIGEVIVRFITWIMSFIGAIAIGFIVYGGIRYVTSAGNEKVIEEAKRIILYAIIGFVIAILAVVIVQLVGGAVTGYACSKSVAEGGKGSEWFCMKIADKDACTSGDVPAGYECEFSQVCTRDGQPVWCCGEETGSCFRCCKRK